MKTMKKWAIVLSLALAAACGDRTAKKPMESRPTAEADSSLRTIRPLGVYEGLLPAADGPGIRYRLALSGREGGREGTFALEAVYLEAENGEDRTFDSEGRWTLQNGMPGDSSATVLRLDSGDSTDRIDFLYMADSIEMLGCGLVRIDSPLNYTLRRVDTLRR